MTFDLSHHLLQGRKLIGRHEHTDRSGDTGFTDDQLFIFQEQDHAVNGRQGAICVTRDNLGPLATNLTLLLQKESNDCYPWVTNIIDLGNLAEAWSFFRWGSKEFHSYLEQRITLYGRVFSDDELDFAGFFIRHGGFKTAVKQEADLLQLDPSYSSIFDEIYIHLHQGGPPPAITQTDPVVMDLKQSLSQGVPVFAEPNHKERRKIGRNAPCPCGSDKKYKRCCGKEG